MVSQGSRDAVSDHTRAVARKTPQSDVWTAAKSFLAFVPTTRFFPEFYRGAGHDLTKRPAILRRRGGEDWSPVRSQITDGRLSVFFQTCHLIGTTDASCESV